LRVTNHLIWLLAVLVRIYLSAGAVFAAEYPSHAKSPLTAEEYQFARTAWAYFVVNEDPKTGLVASVNNFKSTTLWDEGGYFLALTAAYKLGLISHTEATNRLSRLLTSLARLPLYQGKLPNKVYNTSTLEMTDYANKPSKTGLGWSALDIMRLISGMLIATQTFPEYQPQAQRLLGLWQLQLLTHEGRFQGIAVRGQAYDRLVQEGRIGYEQYAGKIGVLIGLPVKLAKQYQPILRVQQYRSIILPGDIRTADSHGVSSITTSEPFMLEALEFGWRKDAHLVATAVYQAQKFRYRETGILTALSEDHIRGKPYFAYNALLMDYTPFVTVTARRKDVSGKRGLSTKASFGWWALMRDDYTDLLLQAVKPLQSNRGWYAGLFENDGSVNKALTLNTNAVVLEALHYKVYGPLFP
jgi:hypothetical protein